MKPTPEQLRAFHKQLFSKRGIEVPSKEETRVLSNANDSAGITPPAYQQFISTLFASHSTFIRNATRIRCNREVYNLPVARTLPVATWVAEAASVPESDPTFEQVSVEIGAIKVSTRISSEFAQDSLPGEEAMIEYLFNLLAMSVAKKFEADAWAGDGTAASGNIDGVFPTVKAWNAGQQHVVCNSGDSAVGVVDIDNLWNVVGRVDEAALPNAKWYCSRQAKYSLLSRLASYGGGNSAVDLSGGWDNAKMLGYPIEVSDAPCFSSTLGADPGADVLCFGDLGLGARWFDRQQVESKAFQETYATTDEILLRTKSRMSGACVFPQAMATLSLAAA